MSNYTALRNYVKAKQSGGFGWGEKYDREISPDKNWPYLCGHYNNLLSLALDWIPPALMNEMMHYEAEHNRIRAEDVVGVIQHRLAVPDEWQPIETAPKGVTDVLDLWAAGERYTDCIWMKPTYATEYCWCHEGSRDCDGPVDEPVPNPTHWMRPPHPPAGEIDRFAAQQPEGGNEE